MIKIVSRISLHLESHISSDAIYHSQNTPIIMTINLAKCKWYAEQNCLDFYEYVARCINHEFLHHILNMEHSYQICCKLDNIAKQNKEYWMW